MSIAEKMSYQSFSATSSERFSSFPPEKFSSFPLKNLIFIFFHQKLFYPNQKNPNLRCFVSIWISYIVKAKFDLKWSIKMNQIPNWIDFTPVSSWWNWLLINQNCVFLSEFLEMMRIQLNLLTDSNVLGIRGQYSCCCWNHVMNE